MPDAPAAPGTVELPDDLDAICARFAAEGWSDGLPVIPPTEARVAAMLEYWPAGRPRLFGPVAPSGDMATAAAVAANAVMAGCEPAWLPAVVAAVEATLDPAYQLASVQTTTHPCSTLVLVNGPARQQLGIACGSNALGAGNRANLCIGRAVRLVLWNIGGGRPPDGDRATLGQPAKLTFCLGENEEVSPWPAFHTTRGLPAGASAVTVHAGEGPHNVVDLDSRDAAGVLQTVAESIAYTGANHYTLKGELLLLLCPEHARLAAAENMSRSDVQRYLWERARRPLSAFSPDRARGIVDRRLGGSVPPGADPQVPVVETPDDLLIVVAGGDGRHSAFVPSFGFTRSVTRPF